MQSRRAYPPDVSEEEWALVAPYLTLLPETAGQREHSLREVFNGLRYVVRVDPRNPPPWWSTAGRSARRPRVARAAWDGHKRTRGSKLHAAVDTLGQVLALHVTPADAEDRAAVAVLAEAVQEATGDRVDLAYVDQGYTGEPAAKAAADHGITLEVVKLSEAKCGFVLLPRR